MQHVGQVQLPLRMQQGARPGPGPGSRPHPQLKLAVRWINKLAAPESDPGRPGALNYNRLSLDLKQQLLLAMAWHDC